METKRMTRVKSIGLLAVAMLMMAGGCHKPPPPPPPPPPQVWHPPTDRPEQLQELSQRVDEFDSSLADLPGRTTEDHRKMVADALKNLSKILRLARGSDVSPQFTNRVAVVDSSQETLLHSDLARPTLEAAENEAVRASI